MQKHGLTLLWFNFTLEGSLAFNNLNHDYTMSFFFFEKYTMSSLLLEKYLQNQNKVGLLENT